MNEKANATSKEFAGVDAAMKAIRSKEGDKRRVKGTIRCPDCAADLDYSIAGNGHIHGKCSGCGLAWTM